MSDKPNRTTLSGITPQHLIRLQLLALDLIGERSVSALIRYIADNGVVWELGPVERMLKADYPPRGAKDGN